MRSMILGLAVVLFAGFVHAETLTFLGAGPYGQVTLSGPATPTAPDPITVLAGVMNWQGTSSTFSTYCIDLSSIITPSQNYTVTQFDLTSTTLFTPTIRNAIVSLFAQQPTAGLVGEDILPAMTANEAATFQVALWDIIENFDGTTGTRLGTPPLTFTDPVGYDPLVAAGWADSAYATSSTPTGFIVQAFIAEGGNGQNQVFLAPGNTVLPVPIPTSLAGSLLLLGGVFMTRRGMRGRAV